MKIGIYKESTELLPDAGSRFPFAFEVDSTVDAGDALPGDEFCVTSANPPR